jgi:hypothetical protein
MDTIRIEGFIAQSPYGTGYSFVECDMTAHGYVTVCPHVLEFTIPQTFNPVAAKVSMLEKQLDKLSEEHHQKVKRIKDRIANLLCIEYSASAA